MFIRREDKRRWYTSPFYDYTVDRQKVTVNVTGSSWGISGLKKSDAVEETMREFRAVGGKQVLDFGTGSWLRYVETVRRVLPGSDLHVVEFDQAFHDGSAAAKSELSEDISFYAPASFVATDKKYDLILLINVLNTVPEEEHRRQIFDHLSRRLNRTGWLLVYQRIWAITDKPDTKVVYNDGWLVPQTKYNYHTYRAKTGAKWFNLRANICGLKAVDTKTQITSNNTFLRVWEKKTKS